MYGSSGFTTIRIEDGEPAESVDTTLKGSMELSDVHNRPPPPPLPEEIVAAPVASVCRKRSATIHDELGGPARAVDLEMSGSDTVVTEQ